MKSIPKLCASLWLIVAVLFFGSCSNSLRISKWKNQELPGNRISKILVVYINNDSSGMSRAFGEELFVVGLRKIGAQAVSSLEEFGYKGLANLEQEQTYLKLCNNGIDAVLTVAVFPNKSLPRKNKQKMNSINSVYFNRIWSYKTLSEIAAKQQSNGKADIVVEAILFDLSTLSSVYWAQSVPMQSHLLQQATKAMSAIVVNDIKKLGVVHQSKDEKEELRTF